MARYRRVRSKLKNRLKSHKSTTTPEPPSSISKFSLLDLPGELRNRIYRMVLVSDEKIPVKRNEFTEPGLLCVCKQIRTETIKVFYVENKWDLYCPDWDCFVHEGFYTHVGRRLGTSAPEEMKTFWNNTGSLKRKAGLLAFVKIFHEDRADLIRGPSYGERETKTPMKRAAMGVFEISRRLSKRPWAEVERVLEVYLEECAKETKGWTWE